MQAFILSLVSASILADGPLCPAAHAGRHDPAQDAVPNGEQRKKSGIVVTGLKPDDGQRRIAEGGALGAKTLPDTPYSITVVDKDDIAKRQANSIFCTARTLATATGLGWSFADRWSAKLTYGYTSKRHRSNRMFVDLWTEAGDLPHRTREHDRPDRR